MFNVKIDPVAIIRALPPAVVKSVYSGRPGCACGCRGTHSESARSVAIVLGKVKALCSHPDVDVHFDNDHIALETASRLYIVSLNA
jgi:hypothetical protein